MSSFLFSISAFSIFQENPKKETRFADLPAQCKEEQDRLFTKYHNILRKYLDENQELQVYSLFQVQAFAFRSEFIPKGYINTLFHQIYDAEIFSDKYYQSFTDWKATTQDTDGMEEALIQTMEFFEFLGEPDNKESEEEEEEDQDQDDS